MSNYSQQSKVLLVSVINQDKGTFISPNDVYFIGPTANDHPDYDTKVTMVALEDSPYRDSKVIEYNKVEFSGIFSVPLIFTAAGNILTTSDLIKRINEEYGTQLDDTDIIVEPVTPVLLSSTVAMVTVRAAPNALIIKGQLTVYFSDTASIRKWIRNVSTEYSSDGKTLRISGSNRRVDKKVVIGNAIDYLPATSAMALSLGADGKFNEVMTLPTQSPVKVRFREGSLLEVVGPSDETSYDRNGKLLRISPQLPPIFETIGNLAQIKATFDDNGPDFNPNYSIKVKRARSGVVYYVDSVNGNDLNGQGTEQSPYKSFNAAITRTPLARTIVIKDGSSFKSGEGPSAPIEDRSLDIVTSGTNKVTLSGACKVSAWTKSPGQDNVYVATLTDKVGGVADYIAAGTSGRATQLTAVASISAAATTKGSYYLEEGKVYVHTLDDRAPDNKLVVISANPVISVKGNSQVYLENLIIVDSINGVVVEATSVDKVPNFYAVNCEFKNSAGRGLSGYGSTVQTEGCKFTANASNATYYDLDRQSPGLGIKSRFSESSNTFEWNGTIDPFMGSTTLAIAGTVGTRCKNVYSNCFGRPILDYGTNTATANYSLTVGQSTINDVLNGALITSGHPDTSRYGRAMTLVFSSKLTQRDGAFTLASIGNGNIYLYDTPVGKMGQYGLSDPYKFIYTSSQRAQQ
ncbi:putative tail fiber protein [Serratia phage vB_SmaM_Yaphecito]|uniref:Putative tail fiber protein n=1 Tax=Serratia phage vB_SmaM_Yaphecito TaxID=2777368 RepID=A0A7T3NC66_9CAUD|nr:putative tail fiber protein [Serratia phage vB_SmaM_Yaphecito]